MYILRIAATEELLAKSATPFDSNYLREMAEKIGRVLEIISPGKNDN